MDTLFKEELEEVENRRGEAVQEELPKPTRGRRKQVKENSRKSVTFKWSWDWDACLEYYLADRTRKEQRHVDRTDMIVQALKEFLTKEGYTPASKTS